MKLIYRIAFCLFLLLTNSLFGQDYAFYKSQLVSEYTHKKNDSNKVKPLKEIVKLALEHRKVPDFFFYSSKLSDLLKIYNNKQELAWLNLQIGQFYADIDHIQTLVYYEKSLALYKEVNDLEGLANIYMHLGGLFEFKEEYNKAYNYHTKAVNLFEQTKSEKLGVAYYNYSLVFTDLKNYQAAENYLLKSKEQSIIWGNSNLATTTTLALIGIKMELGNYFLAKKMIQEHLNTVTDILKKNMLELMLAKCKIQLDEPIHFNLNEINVYELIKINGDARYGEKRGIVNLLHNIYKDIGDHEHAYEYLILQNDLDENFTKTKVESQFEKLNVIYDVQQKELELLKVREQNEEILLENKLKQKLLYLSVIVILLIVALLFAIIYYLSKLKQKSKYIEKQKNEIELAYNEVMTLTKELNHRVKNNLQIISSIIMLSSTDITNTQFNIILQNIQSRISSIALLHKHLSFKNVIDEVNLKEYLSLVAVTVNKTYISSDTQVILDISIADLFVSTKKAVNFAMILNELMTNSFKHVFKNGKEGKITITLVETSPKNYKFVYSDEGIVDEQRDFINKSSTSLGADLIKYFSEKIKGSLDVKLVNSHYVYIINFES